MWLTRQIHDINEALDRAARSASRAGQRSDELKQLAVGAR
jgi:hypothetical protein